MALNKIQIDFIKSMQITMICHGQNKHLATQYDQWSWSVQSLSVGTNTLLILNFGIEK